MASLNFKSNIAKGFKADALIDNAYAVGGGVVYRVLPSLFGMNGWLAGLLGFAVPYVAGKAFDIPGLSNGATGAFAAHILTLAEPQFEKMTNKKFFTLTERTTDSTTATTPPAAAAFSEGINDNIGAVYPGTDLLMYNPEDIRSTAISPGVNDGMGAVRNTVPANQEVRQTFANRNASTQFSSSSLW
ncbi:MAG: hypothetical protein JNL32_00225 [Candidatus Kapabacteria bacterium]|nr:hypothetical protein [Candidatus Kapabacteria bacterium]